jgi:hypothetical protein
VFGHHCSSRSTPWAEKLEKIVSNLLKLAKAEVATTLRIEGTFANPDLLEVLARRCGFATEGANEYIELTVR